MMLRTPDYIAAREEAQRLANQGRRPIGIEACRELDGQQVYQLRYLPREDQRFGHDHRMEAVEPDPEPDLEVEREEEPGVYVPPDGWLCGCGAGALRGGPPPCCPCCGFCFESFDLD
jgi:hypothetical protein